MLRMRSAGIIGYVGTTLLLSVLPLQQAGPWIYRPDLAALNVKNPLTSSPDVVGSGDSDQRPV